MITENGQFIVQSSLLRKLDRSENLWFFFLQVTNVLSISITESHLYSKLTLQMTDNEARTLKWKNNPELIKFNWDLLLSLFLYKISSSFGCYPNYLSTAGTFAK